RTGTGGLLLMGLRPLISKDQRDPANESAFRRRSHACDCRRDLGCQPNTVDRLGRGGYAMFRWRRDQVFSASNRAVGIDGTSLTLQEGARDPLPEILEPHRPQLIVVESFRIAKFLEEPGPLYR